MTKSNGTQSGHNVQKVKSQLNVEAIKHLKDIALDNRVLDELEEDISIEELEDLEQNLSATDPNFRSDLEYNGYKHIEGQDNDEYLGNMDDVADDRKELNLSDRLEDDSIGVEENAIDPQENRKQV